MTNTNPYASSGPVAQKTNVLAIISLIAGFIVPLLGVILGFVALSQIKKTGENGHGLAIGGIVVGFIVMILSIVVVVLPLILTASTATYYSY